MKTFLSELRRRNVVRVALAYALVGFVVLQAADIIFPALLLPDWSLRLLLALLLLGFPVSLVVAWAFELTPEGVKRTDSAPAEGVTAGEAAPPGSRPFRIAVACAVLIGVVSAGWWAGRSTPAATIGVPQSDSATADRSIAVLPFANLSDEPGSEYFSDGITEDILTNLALIRDLRVVSRTSVMKYRGTTKGIPEIGRELGVRYVLEGSVRRVGDKVRITGQLIEAETDAHLWASNYDRDVTDVFAIQTEIARAIADALQAKLSEAETARLAGAPPTASIAAYEEYLKGRQLFRQNEPEAWASAIAHQRRALALDPEFGLAHAALAELLSLQFERITGDSAALHSASAAANRAVELVPDRPEAWIALARTRWNAGAYDEVEPLVERALELNPNDPQALSWSSGGLIRDGRLAEALRVRKRAAEADPSDADQMLGVADIYRLLRQYDLAETWIERAAALDYAAFRNARARVLRDQGRHDEALVQARAFLREAGEMASRQVLVAGFEVNAGEIAAAVERLERAGRELPHFAPRSRSLRMDIYRHYGDESGFRRVVEEARAAGDAALLRAAAQTLEGVANARLEGLRTSAQRGFVDPGELQFGLAYIILRGRPELETLTRDMEAIVAREWRIVQQNGW